LVKIKICGITDFEDARTAVELGADFIGFVFASSPRQVTPETARAIIGRLPEAVEKVGVFAGENADKVIGIAGFCGLDWLQFHGDETPDYCRRFEQKVIKAVRIKDIDSLVGLDRYEADAFLLDTFSDDRLGGTGRVFDWRIAVEAKRFGRIFLAGGLDPDNVADAVRLVKPYAVDVSSGVESSPGKKSREKMEAFIEACRAASKGIGSSSK
jgi:phosphoribosylanthranilate isomerase